MIPHHFRRFLSRTTIFSGAVLAILLGLRLSIAGDSLQGFSGAFLAITGVQVALWALGIRLEILGNAIERVPVTVGENREFALPVYESLGMTMPAKRKSIEVRLRRLEGRLLSMSGYVLAEASIATPLKTRDKDKLADAVALCQQGYEVLRKVGGPAEIAALNNLVFYSCVLNDQMRSEFLLSSADRLMVAGQEHDVANVILTACRAFLQFSKDPMKRERAIEILSALKASPSVSNRERREATMYIQSFSEYVLDERAPERSGRTTELTKRHIGTSTEDSREYFEHVVLPEARVLALAEYDRIEEVGEVDLEKRARELTARHASDLGLDDEWKEWFG